jgi:glycosyltransferase involved in cell wall biosynthesis
VNTVKRIAFVCPRFAEGGTVGGAETLLRNLATQAAKSGQHVTFLTTCATSHVSWTNTLPPGRKSFNGVDVHFFPVDQDRDEGAFLRAQQTICSQRKATLEDETEWVDNGVHSSELYAHLDTHREDYDRIIMGPYLFGLVYKASTIIPEKTVLVPCLHDESFAYLDCTRKLFERVHTVMFNAQPERALAGRLFDFPEEKGHVVGMGLDPVDIEAAAATASGPALPPQYVIYCGRRETMKGTPLLTDYLTVFRQRTGRDIRIVFTGSGSIEAPDALRPAIIDLGFVSEAHKHAAMAGAVAFCHPSVNESLGIVILESWLCGTPVLVHAVSDVLRDHCARSGGGLWFRNYPEFEESLTLMLDRSDLNQAMGAAGRTYVQQEYSWERVTQKMFHALNA